MRSLIVIAFVLGSGIIYLNLVIAQNEEEKHQRFIISQEEKVVDSEILSASLLNAKEEETINEAQDIEIETIPESDVAKNIGSVLEDLESNKIEPLEPKNTTPEDLANGDTENSEAPQFQLVKTIPGKGITTWESGKDIVFEFNQAVDLESFFTHIQVSPSADGKFSGEMNYGENNKQIIIKPIPVLQKEVLYTFTLGKGLLSFDKNSLTDEEITLQFLVK